MLQRADRARQRSAQAGIPTSRSAAARAIPFAVGNRAIGRIARSLQGRQLQRVRVDTSTGSIETDDYSVPELVEMVLQLSASEQKLDVAAARTLRQMLGSTSGSHLLSENYDERMQPRGPLALGVQERYLQPTTPPVNAQPGVPQRSISSAQVNTYGVLEKAILAQEAQYAATHVPFYHGQDPRWRVAQDVYRLVRARMTGEQVPANFHFMRYPGPTDKTYAEHKDVQAFFKADMEQHGIIDDNLPETKKHIMSTNIALHGGLGHTGEETFHYFQVAKGQTVPDVAGAIRTFLADYRIDATGDLDPLLLISELASYNDTPEGSLFQILVPRKIVDKVAYLAHPHGLPHDDELFEELHGMTPIRYNDVKMPGNAGTPVDRQTRYQELLAEEQLADPVGGAQRARQRLGVGLMEREKMNTEVTRNLVEARAIWGTRHTNVGQIPPPSVRPGERVTAAEVAQARAQLDVSARLRRERTVRETVQYIHDTMRERFDAGEYGPSRHIDDFINRPEDLAHPEFNRQRERVKEEPEKLKFPQQIREAEERARVRALAKRSEVNVRLAVAAAVEKMSIRNPEHFGEGQGIRSKHENMRIRNRLNFIQARMLINEQLTLNPGSGIIINRFTTMQPAAQQEYEKRLAAYVERLFAKRT